MAAKITKSRCRRNGLTDLYESWYGDAKWGLIAPTVENSEFQKWKMADAAILKTVKLQYICKCSAIFDEICHTDAY